MSVLQVEGLVKYYGEFLMFNGLSFTLSEKQRVALIARNGAGKTTLFNIISGLDAGSEGTITKNPNYSFAILEQDEKFEADQSIIDAVFSSDDPAISAVKQYDVALESGDAKAIDAAVVLMEQHNAWDLETNAKQILSKLKITDLTQSIATLSGGQRKRLSLAKVLLQKPDVLLLDEPTNHLDMDMIDWLEGYLRASNTTILMITHDRYFIDRLCDSIYELDGGVIQRYNGNYSYYLEKKQEFQQAQETIVEKAKNLYKKELQWIRRQPKARGTKSKSRIDAFKEIKKVAHTNLRQDQVTIQFKGQRVGSKILEVLDISKSFGDNTLFKSFTYNFTKGEKIALVGENGSGKSSFLKILTGHLESDTGTIDVGETIKFGYYKQDGLPTYPADKKVIDVITDISESITIDGTNYMTPLKYLEFFLFPPSMHHVSVNKLSGGERKRLYLMTVLMGQPNFLVLDEPTNDLDILTLNVLENFLSNFNGCAIIVSHDRYFTDKVVDNLFVFDKQKSSIMNFPGNYSDYLEYKKFEESQASVSSHEKVEKKQKDVKPKKSNLTYAERLELESIESEIDGLNEKKSGLENKLSEDGVAPETIMEISNEISEILSEVEMKELRWMELLEKQDE